jgi:RNA polymerase sigma-70 factor (ECF subfamily)
MALTVLSHPPARADEPATHLALAARDGDAAALDGLVRALHLDVRRYVAYLSADPESTDDLTQETFLRALVSLHRFEGRSSARIWLLAIARRTVADSIRRQACRPKVAHDWDSAPDAAVPGFEEGVVLTDLFQSLPTHHRDAFVLTQVLELPYHEAAVTLDCPIGTIRSRVARARTALREEFAAVAWPERWREATTLPPSSAATATAGEADWLG